MRILISMPDEFTKKLDELAKKEMCNRSEYIRMLVRKEMDKNND